MRAPFPSLIQLRDFVGSQLALLREDHMRLMNPTPYKVSVTTDLFHYINDLMMKELPIAELE
jgi:nicotinate phosphoribosyltransferase